MLRILSFLPLRILYVFSDFFFFIGYYLIRYRHQVIRNNLVQSFPGKSNAEIKKISKDFYAHLCDYVFETIKLITISGEELNQRMKFRNTEQLDRFVEKKIPIIGLSSHNFNWEWVLVSANANMAIKWDFVYMPITSNSLDQFLLNVRSRFGGYPIKRMDLGRELIRRKGVFRGIAILGDQFPGHQNDKYFWKTFLHQSTVFNGAVNQLPFTTQYPVIMFNCHRKKRGYYEVTFDIIGEPPHDKNFSALDIYAEKLEGLIQSNPSNWLWSHKRWKEVD
ncbi:MAG: lauroyl acyltransferase [Flammeovirgaceae bacterium]|nr:lauroyl acyltransferase [Flammeovirgaceae bacterium]